MSNNPPTIGLARDARAIEVYEEQLHLQQDPNMPYPTDEIAVKNQMIANRQAFNITNNDAEVLRQMALRYPTTDIEGAPVELPASIKTPVGYSQFYAYSAQAVKGLARGLQWGGISLSAWRLTQATRQTVATNNPTYAMMQVNREVGGIAGAMSGAQAGFAIGAALGIETGPGAVLFGLGGSLIFGTLGYFGVDYAQTKLMSMGGNPEIDRFRDTAYQQEKKVRASGNTNWPPRTDDVWSPSFRARP